MDLAQSDRCDMEIRTRCLQCRDLFRWTLSRCPRCLRANENRPLMILCKVGALVIICVAIWYTILFIMVADDRASGVLDSVPEQRSAGDSRLPH